MDWIIPAYWNVDHVLRTRRHAVCVYAPNPWAAGVTARVHLALLGATA
jgi:hypothetical protein